MHIYLMIIRDTFAYFSIKHKMWVLFISIEYPQFLFSEPTKKRPSINHQILLFIFYSFFNFNLIILACFQNGNIVRIPVLSRGTT